MLVRPINTNGLAPAISTPFIEGSHPGIDYAYNNGREVYASDDGTVTIAKNDESRQWIANSNSDPFPHPRALRTEDYGNMVKIDHGNALSTINAHLQKGSVLVKVGDKVKKGQLIARVGSTGNSTGNHDHFEVRKNDVAVNPGILIDTTYTGYGSAPTPTPPINDDEAQARLQAKSNTDKFLVHLKDAKRIDNADSKFWLLDKNDPEKFLGLLKAIWSEREDYRKKAEAQPDIAKAKEEGRKIGVKQVQDAALKVV